MFIIMTLTKILFSDSFYFIMKDGLICLKKDIYCNNSFSDILTVHYNIREIRS